MRQQSVEEHGGDAPLPRDADHTPQGSVGKKDAPAWHPVVRVAKVWCAVV